MAVRVCGFDMDGATYEAVAVRLAGVRVGEKSRSRDDGGGGGNHGHDEGSCR